MPKAHDTFTPDTLIGAGALAAACQVGRNTITLWHKRGAIAARRSPTGRLRIALRDAIPLVRSQGLPLPAEWAPAAAQLDGASEVAGA